MSVQSKYGLTKEELDFVLKHRGKIEMFYKDLDVTNEWVQTIVDEFGEFGSELAKSFEGFAKKVQESKVKELSPFELKAKKYGFIDVEHMANLINRFPILNDEGSEWDYVVANLEYIHIPKYKGCRGFSGLVKHIQDNKGEC